MAGQTPRLSPADRRELLISSAARLFAEGGYDGTNLERIATDAGVTKPVVYRHFDSKKTLYLALLERHSESMPSFVADLPETREPRELLQGVLDTWLSWAAENPFGWQLLFRDAGGDEEIRAYRQAVSGRARYVIAEFLLALPGVDLPPDQLEPTAELLRGGLASMVLWWQENPDVPRSALVASSARVLAGLANSGR